MEKWYEMNKEQLNPNAVWYVDELIARRAE
jgi:hypothetical protein